MTRLWTDAEDYEPSMEAIESDIMDTVLSEVDGFDPSSYTESDVRRALSGDPGIEGFAALLSPTAGNMLEEIAVREIMHEMAKKYLSVLKKLKVVLMESNKNRKIPESAIRNLLIRELIRNQPKKK